MKAKELREKTADELTHLLTEKLNDLMHFRMQMATGVVDNVRMAREARKDIARIKTIMNERSRTATATAADAGDQT